MANTHAYIVNPGWRLLLIDLGIQPANVLKRANLPGDLFGRQKAQLGTKDYFRLWQGIEEEAGDPTLPLRIGAAISVEAFDPAIFAALSSPNLNTALERISRYKKLIAPMALHVDAGNRTTSLELEWLDNSVKPPVSLVATELVFFVQLARIVTRTRIEPRQVISPHLPGSLDDYAAYFGVRMNKGSRPKLRFSAADAARPFLTSNEKMWTIFEPELRKRLADLDESAATSDRVRAALLELLPGGSPTMGAVSKKLGTSTRTLQRRLQQEGLSFQTVLNRTRESLAEHYLKQPAMTSTEISFLLGFEDPNSFFRAFNAWTGQTPGQVRNAMLGPS